MSTVQVQMGRLAQLIDPKTVAGVDITSANVGSVDGARFSKSRLLDIYNQARIILSNVIQQKLDPVYRREAVANNILTVSSLTFSGGVATKPAGYVSTFLLRSAAGQIITVLPFALAYATRHRDGINNPLVYEKGTTLASENGNTYIPNASTYIIDYFGVSYFTLTDITGGTVPETFNQIWEPVLLELAQRISLEQGLTDINALADSLVGGGRQQ